VVLFAIAAALGLQTARAEEPSDADRKQKPLSKAELDEFAELDGALSSGDPAQIEQGLLKLQTVRHKAYAALVEKVLVRGGNEPVVRSALSVARRFASESSSAVVAPYLSHRLAVIRREAVLTLAATKVPAAVAALKLCLRNSDAGLREACATALGDLADPSAVPDLLVALDRGITAAALSIGKLCGDDACGKFVERLGKVPFEAMSEGLVEAIVRTDGRVSADTKVSLIASVANLRTPEAKASLRGALSRFPEKGDAKVKGALNSVIESFGTK
jgi:HEAT repeat protein